MVITSRGKNALKFMIDLALYQSDGYIPLKDIARREDISEKYLEQIATVLKKTRIVNSAKGTNGGYQLIKSADMYTVGEILKSVEGDLYPTDCAHGDSICDQANGCFCFELWEKLYAAMNDVLEGTSLQDLIDWEKSRSTCHTYIGK